MPLPTSQERRQGAQVGEESRTGAGRPGKSRARTYQVDPLRDPRWNTLVETHPYGSVFHSRPWLMALHACYGYEPLVVTSSGPGLPIQNGLLFCRVNSWLTGRRYVSLPFSDHCEPLVNHPEELDDLLLPMRLRVDEGECRYVELRPRSAVPLQGHGMQVGSRYLLHRLSLRPSLDQLFSSFHKSCVQRTIRRSERENLQYAEGTSEVLLLQFYRLLMMTRRRQNLPPQPLEWFRSLILALGSAMKIRAVSCNGRPVASIITLSHKRTLTYKYGCSDPAFHRLGGTSLLFWKMIQDGKASGFETLDLGRSDTDNSGLIRFKERWGAEGSEISYWEYSQASKRPPRSYPKALVKNLVRVCPDTVLKAIGSAMYRHVG
jgi:hypothetical protein